MSMMELSKHVLNVGRNCGVTNLQLQKVMYFTLKDYLKDEGESEFIEKLYDEPFETWQYGPVVPDLYYRYSGNGSMTINDEGKYNNKYSIFDKAIKKYLSEDVFELVERSHQEKFWKEHQGENQERDEYTLDDIIGE
ncbi:DUF4065 domain-containing protein [Pediococcus stilesii]|uniref:DUF4065 domain-containing protein n=1 Tax=Pediococcus stilesii TaxID=331679 RepID=A0A5R9BTX8_9LACO|nr:type II toxin-antitoxin system antitoxin SocA domain-containing protein [Pediococcus stilesii]TLQ03462.1 DUF4065 domain-containing protein [Pediococcus stilesii]